MYRPFVSTGIPHQPRPKTHLLVLGLENCLFKYNFYWTSAARHSIPLQLQGSWQLWKSSCFREMSVLLLRPMLQFSCCGERTSIQAIRLTSVLSSYCIVCHVCTMYMYEFTLFSWEYRWQQECPCMGDHFLVTDTWLMDNLSLSQDFGRWWGTGENAGYSFSLRGP